MFKVGLIGCGGMGGHHAGILAAMENVDVVGVCDVIEEKARELGERIGVKWRLDYRELLDEVDAVWVCTEPLNRLDIVTGSAGTGKHVFTEKPICLDLSEADEMIAATREAGVKYMLGYCLRFTNPYKLIHDAFARGELGELVNCWTRRYMPFDASKTWYGRQDKSGGVTLDFGSHDCDWLRWIGGDVKTVFAKTFKIRQTANGDEHGQMLMLFENGGMGSMDVSWSSYLSESSVGVVGTEGAMIVGLDGKVRRKIGEDGEEETLDTESAMDVDPAGSLGKKDASGRIQAAREDNETMQEHFFRCIEEDIEPLTPGSEGRKTLATLKALQQSARRGRSVAVAEMG